jgi:hypothetical protein
MAWVIVDECGIVNDSYDVGSPLGVYRTRLDAKKSLQEGERIVRARVVINEKECK